MMKRFLFHWLLLAMLVSPGLAMAAETIDSKVIFGRFEQVFIKELGLALPAKMDTGAESASLSAKHIREYKKDGHRMVKFDLALAPDLRDKLGLDDKDTRNIKLPLAGHVHIKKRAESMDDEDHDSSKRLVTELTLCIDGRQTPTRVNLTNREHFKYPLLVGARGLKALKAVIDPSLADKVRSSHDSKKAAKQCDQ